MMALTNILRSVNWPSPSRSSNSRSNAGGDTRAVRAEPTALTLAVDPLAQLTLILPSSEVKLSTRQTPNGRPRPFIPVESIPAIPAMLVISSLLPQNGVSNIDMKSPICTSGSPSCASWGRFLSRMSFCTLMTRRERFITERATKCARMSSRALAAAA